MKEFLIIAGFMGLLFLPIIVMFLLCGADTKHKVGGALFTFAFWLLFAGGITLQNHHNDTLWNGGYCSCGSHWELSGASKTRNGSTTKYYSCPKCYNEITISI